MEHIVHLPHATEEQRPLAADVAVNGDDEERTWTWVLDVEKALRGGGGTPTMTMQQRQQWRTTSCIYLVPERNRKLNITAYTPQLVSFGPFHHGLASLRPMEEHKHRALLHFLRRACKPLSEFVAAMEGAAEQLEGMYQGLPAEWRDRRRLVRLMVLDGCFMLEVVRAATATAENDYHVDDPVFGWHGAVNTIPYVRRDMLLIENQLPLLVLLKLITVESGRPDPSGIKRQVLKFLSPSTQLMDDVVPEGLHPLQLFRWSRVAEQRSTLDPATNPGDVPSHQHQLDQVPAEAEQRSDISAMDLRDAGIHLRKLSSKKISDIRLAGHVLSLPTLTVNELTEPIFVNLVAFERLHVGLSSPFRLTAYLFFMCKVVKTAEDVAFLRSKGIIRNALDDGHKVAELFARMSADLHVYPPEEGGRLVILHQQLEKYCQEKWRIWRAHIARTYFRSPWAPLSLAGSVFFLTMTAANNIYNLLRVRH
ncbi:UPF0481 protein At3g47200-like [Triticum dicoccoides]|uniref:UPF0481 protein At3g47200-like n=1 Tax=Triticum dicoccoides TaxID=85692 RepID=UPI00188F2E4C|nr:UPF0481 protein At3g47200-like [Triticum dicoccoides]